MRARDVATLAATSLMSILVACGQPSEGGDAADPAMVIDDMPDDRIEEAPVRPPLKGLGPNGRRVKVIVLPGDAAVEVDDAPVLRRDGVIELTGKVDEVRRLRVFKGLQNIEQDVIIKEAGALPPLLDLNARSAQVAWPGSAKPVESSTPSAPATDVLLRDHFE